MQAAAVITASGHGRRMGTGTKKQYLLLEGIPVLARSVNAFVNHESIIQTVVVVPPGELALARKILKPFCPIDRIIFVEGGIRRQDSVYNGIESLPPGAELICIHDGVRPLVAPALIHAVLEAAAQKGAAVPVIPVNDTIKEVAACGLIKATVSRENLRRAQTPQAFRSALIREAYHKTRLLGVEATDDSYLLELLDHPVYTVNGDPANIKITAPHDLLAAAAILKELS